MEKEITAFKTSIRFTGGLTPPKGGAFLFCAQFSGYSVTVLRFIFVFAFVF